MDSRVLEIINGALEARGVKTDFACLAMCEMDVRKQRWALAWNPDWPVPRDGHVTPCMFVNMQDMGKQFARCCVHGLQEQDRFTNKEPQQCCPVPKADIVFGGASCKYFSNINVNKKHSSSSEMLGNPAASDHSCYVIFKGFLRYLEEHQPAIFV